MLDKVVYYSSATNNTHTFVEKLGFDAVRIPIKPSEKMIEVNWPYVLIIPTYGGGASIMGRKSRPVLPQIKSFLEHGDNASYMKAVIASGNLNFGSDYGKAGDVISKKFGVPYVYRFELYGNNEDVEIVRNGLLNFEYE